MPYQAGSVVRPQPRPRRPRPGRARTVVPAGTGQSLAQQLGGWAGVPRVYISFSPQTSTSPTWLEVTPWVDTNAAIKIQAGRADGLSDVNASTCTLTVDNSDGRWSATNPAGAWYGQIRKGCWLRVDLLPLSGTVSRRWTGYITGLPTTWEGQYPTAQISGADVLSLLGTAPKLTSMISEDFLSDPIGSPYVIGYWPLNEPQGSSYALDISGKAAPGAASLAIASHGVMPGAGLTWGNTPAPGPDQQNCVSFTPSGTLLPAVGSGTTGAYPNGSYLQGTLQLGGLSAQITCWVKTTAANQPIWSWADPTTNYVCGLMIDANGYAAMCQGPLSGASSAIGSFIQPALSNYAITDGRWHMLSLRIQTAVNDAGPAYWALVVDGVQTFNGFFNPNPASGMSAAAALSRFTLGASEAWSGTATAGLAMFTGSISDLVAHVLPTGNINFNWVSPWQAGATGHAGETTGTRISRLAAYAGLTAPQATFTLPGTSLPAYQPTTGLTTAVNINTTAHSCGPQVTAGQDPITAMRTVAHTENMPLYVDAFGRITLQASTLRQNPAPALTINALDLDPATGWADDYQYLVNVAVISPAASGQVTVTTAAGQASQALYGPYSTTVETVSASAAEAVSLGAAIIAQNATPAPRPAPLACEAATLALLGAYGPAWYDQILALTVSSLVQVTGWPAASHYAGGTSRHLLEGWTETIGAGTHLFAWSTSTAPIATYQLDSATLGLLDTPGIVLAY